VSQISRARGRAGGNFAPDIKNHGHLTEDSDGDESGVGDKKDIFKGLMRREA